MHPSLSFVCCVESGHLEAQTVRVIESVRRHGGRFAKAPIFAVTPRPGMPLMRSTLEHFERHDVRYVRESKFEPLDWFKFRNKPRAVVIADRLATTDVLCWIDSDLLFLGEPSELDMQGVDFVACASDKEMGTGGPGDVYEPFWAFMCQTLGITLDDLPWLTTEMDKQRVRAYWNGGFFAYRRSTGFAQEYLDVCDKLLTSRTLTNAPGFGLGINEMSAIGFAMVRLELSYRALPFTHNYPWGSVTPPAWHSDDVLKQVRILHYHDSMWDRLWPTFISALQRVHPHVAEWLEPMGPMRNEAPFAYRAINRGLGELRAWQERQHLAKCRTIEGGAGAVSESGQIAAVQ